jgi:hypothetical protein
MFNNIEETNNLSIFLQQIFVIFFLALPIMFVDIKIQQIRNKNKNLKITYRVFLLILQNLIAAGYIYFLMKKVNFIERHFQSTSAGMFFPGFFFSMQGNMFSEIQNLFKDI